MDTRFGYLLERIAEAELADEPFPHLYLDDFLRDEDFDEVVASREVSLPPSDDIDELFASLAAVGYERIDFPGCVRTKEDYLRWIGRDSTPPETQATCEAQGMAFRMADARDDSVVALEAFFRSEPLRSLLVDKFGITRTVEMEGGLQKYLHGYEISPHPDIRKKALTWMLNVNPAADSERLPFHTHYMQLKPEWSYIATYWRDNPQAETCWVPWDWCTTAHRQVENNSIVFFAPRWDTMHGVRAHYDHLPAQRTQFYGNLWYAEPDPPITVRPDHEDLSFATTKAELVAEHDRLRAELQQAEHRATELQGRLDGILSRPAVRVARRVRDLARSARDRVGGAGREPVA